MKKIILLLVSGFIGTCLAKDSEFMRFKESGAGREKVFGFVGQVYWTSIRDSWDVPSSRDQQGLAQYASDQGVFNRFLKCYQATVGRARSNLYLERSIDGAELFSCGRSKKLLDAWHQERVVSGQAIYRQRGYELRSNDLQVFPVDRNDRDSIYQFDKDGEARCSSQAEILPGEQAAFVLPCIVLAAGVRPGSNVSDLELGYMASRAMEQEGNVELRSSDGNAALKKTVLGEDSRGSIINLLDLMPRFDDTKE